MREHQWEVSSPDGSVVLLFGTTDTGIQTASRPDLGQRGVRTTDAPRPREDGDGFGIDYDEGKTITFECHVLTPDDHAAQVNLLDRMWDVWASPVFRETEQAHGILRTHTAGRERLTYGRPRRFAEADGNMTHHGWTTVVAEFRSMDGKWYDADEQSTSLSITPPDSVGFTTPIVTQADGTAFQTATLDTDSLPGAMTVEGEATWPVVTFHGPVTTPRVLIGDLVIELDTTIAEGQSVTIDTRPWNRGVLRSDGANLAGRLTWQTPPLSRARVQPGVHQIVYYGNDVTGTSWVEVRWRNAHNRP